MSESTSSEGLAPVANFDEAVERALGEIDLAESVAEEEALPAESNEPVAELDDAELEVEGQASEQPDDETFDFDLEEESDTEPTEEVSGINDNTLLRIAGFDEPVSLGELAQGYLRQADYTRKTQELAELRKKAEESAKNVGEGAAALWESLKDDPSGTAAYLAVRAGLLTEDQVPKRLKEVEGIRLVDEATLDALVQERLDAAVREDPRVQEAQYRRVQQTIDSQFAEIESAVGKPLSERARVKTLEFATQHGIADLRVAFAALRGQTSTKQPKDTPRSPERPTAKPRAEKPVKGEVVDFEESARRALADLGIEI